MLGQLKPAASAMVVTVPEVRTVPATRCHSDAETVGTIILPVLLRKRLELREVEGPVEGHRAGKWQVPASVRYLEHHKSGNVWWG